MSTSSLMRLALIVTTLMLSSVAHALPRALSVPGGIVLIDLGVVVARANPPAPGWQTTGAGYR